MFRAMPDGFTRTVTDGSATRITWRTRDAIGSWMAFGTTLTATLATSAGLAHWTDDGRGLATAGVLLAVGLAACALQLVRLRRAFFLELRPSELATSRAVKAVPFSDLLRATMLERIVERQHDRSTTIDRWFELWLHRTSGEPIQVGARLDYFDAMYLRAEVAERVPRLASTDERTDEDRTEAGGLVGPAVGLLVSFGLVLALLKGLESNAARTSSMGMRAFALAEADPHVARVLGTPLAWGWSAHVDTPKPFAARLSGAVQGSRGSGTLVAKGYWKNAQWCFAVLEVNTAQGPVVLQRPECSLTAFEWAEVYYEPPPPKSGGGH